MANYTPDANFNGTDTFTYKANDGISDSNIATVTMTVSAEDDEPNTIDVATTTDEDVAVTVNLSADEYDGDSYSFAIITDVSNGTSSLNGTVITYTPNQDWNGTDTFTFEATDDRTSRTNVATATIVVNPINDAPVLSNISNQTIEENDSLDLFLQVVDADTGETLIFSASSNSSEIDFIINSADSMLKVIPAADWNGSANIMIIVSDGELQDSTSFLFTVGSVNDAPVIEQISNMVINEDDLLEFSVEISDARVNVAGFVLASTPKLETLSFAPSINAFNAPL